MDIEQIANIKAIAVEIYERAMCDYVGCCGDIDSAIDYAIRETARVIQECGGSHEKSSDSP